MKTTILFSVVALAVRVYAAVPPACLLSAVNNQDAPGDLGAVCGDEALEVQEAIASLCTGDNVSVAQSAFISTCSAAGSSVAPYTATATNSATATGSGSSTVTTGASGSRSSGASATNSAGGSSATGNAAADPKKQVGSFAAAAIAIAGVVAVL